MTRCSPNQYAIKNHVGGKSPPDVIQPTPRLRAGPECTGKASSPKNSSCKDKGFLIWFRLNLSGQGITCSLMESDRGRESMASRSWDLQCDHLQLTLEITSVSSGRPCSTKSQGRDLGELLNQMEGGGKKKRGPFI